MSVIIRLQGLPWTANALDIRQYFDGLTIPEGGVHIVGGDDGDAFIAFSSDEDARQAMLMDGGRIKEASKVKLMLSSRAEMQKVIEAARNRNMVMQGLLAASAAVATGGSGVGVPTVPLPSTAAQLIGGGVGGGGGGGPRQQQLQLESTSPLAGKLPTGAASELSLQQQLFMNRAAAAAAAAAMSSMPAGNQMPFQLQQLKLSTMEMLQGDMRQLMMQNMGMQSGIGIGSNAQSNLPNSDNAVMGMGSVPAMTSPSYEPTKKSVTPSVDRDVPGRDRERDRDNFGRRSNRNDRRGSRSPRRRSRERDRDVGGGGGGGSSRRRDRRRSPSRGRSRERSSDRTRMSSGGVGVGATRSAAIDPFVGIDNNDREAEAIRRRLMAENNGGGPVHTVNGKVVLPVNDDNRQRNSRWDESSDVSGLNAVESGPNEDRMPLRPQHKQDSDMMLWERNVEQQRPQMHGDGAGGGPQMLSNPNSHGPHPPPPPPSQLPPRQNGPFGLNVRQQHQQGGNQPDRMMISMCVVMRGIPFDTHPMSIREYFQGLNIPPDGIRLLIDTIGNRPHLAFVRFTNEFDRDIVLKRQSHFFQGLMVEVLPCTEEDFLRIPMDSMGRGGGGGGGGPGEIDVWSKDVNQRFQHRGIEEENCLFIKGIPFKCVDKDIYEFFDGFRIVDALIEYLRQGKSAGTGFAEFVSPMEARRALELDGQKMDFRNIELRLSTKQSMMTARRQTNEKLDERPFLDRPPMPGMMMPPPPSMNNEGAGFGRLDCCLITGLPLNATDRDILDFFAPADIAPMVIHVMLDTAGRPMGDAFCEFSNPRDCHRAVQMDGLPLRPPQSGPRFSLNIRPVTRMELDAALGAISTGPTIPMSSPSVVASNSGPRTNGGGPSPFVQNQNVKSKADGADDGGPVQTGGIGNKSAVVPPQQQSPRGPLSLTGSATTPAAVEQSSPIKQQQQQSPILQRPMGPSFFGRPSEPGCILEVQNLPFLSTSEDILKHFHGYALTKESIMRRFRENGAPTGDARLLFRNSKDAQAAYRQLNSVMMCGRVLNLKILS